MKKKISLEDALVTLKTNNKITVIKNEFYKMQILYDEFLNDHSFLKPYNEEVLYLNDNSVLWNYEEENKTERPGGGFMLKSVYDMINLQQELIYLNTTLNNFMVFETHPDAGDGLMIGVVVNDKNMLEVWIYDNGTAYRMNINFKEYFLELAFYRGIYNWQFLFVNKTELIKTNQFMYDQIPAITALQKELFT